MLTLSFPTGPFQVWAEYKVIKETSALTFMIAGTVKEVATGARSHPSIAAMPCGSRGRHQHRMASKPLHLVGC